jgi:hypothetical protein
MFLYVLVPESLTSLPHATVNVKGPVSLNHSPHSFTAVKLLLPLFLFQILRNVFIISNLFTVPHCAPTKCTPVTYMALLLTAVDSLLRYKFPAGPSPPAASYPLLLLLDKS